ncbi:CBL-interacting protein kinase 21 [Hibiscus syriacus]|uniref:CBL-interacting protein kinase 21 n=1 Tax=Hibiscus syriacus TaxID=106335 RepID=A0A6A2ZH41_HIBSY|nr:CBL-interacting protein kinase 21 [Hibiscus syriacus]
MMKDLKDYLGKRKKYLVLDIFPCLHPPSLSISFEFHGDEGNVFNLGAIMVCEHEINFPSQSMYLSGSLSPLKDGIMNFGFAKSLGYWKRCCSRLGTKSLALFCLGFLFGRSSCGSCRSLTLENVLIDANGNIKISDFGLSALPYHVREDGLLHTTRGSPNYVAQEILANRGYNGAASDIWSCSVILYVILTGYLPFDDRNLSVLYQKIFKGDTWIPKWLSSGAWNMIRRILDPKPVTRITMAEIKADKWFKQDYTPAVPDDEEEDTYIDDEAFSVSEVLIGMSSFLDLSGFFEEDVSERTIRFTSNHSAEDLLARIQDIVTEMGFRAQTKHRGLKSTLEHRRHKCVGSLSVAAELCSKLSKDLGVPQGQGQGQGLVSIEA